MVVVSDFRTLSNALAAKTAVSTVNTSSGTVAASVAVTPQCGDGPVAVGTPPEPKQPTQGE